MKRSSERVRGWGLEGARPEEYQQSNPLLALLFLNYRNFYNIRADLVALPQKDREAYGA